MADPASPMPAPSADAPTAPIPRRRRLRAPGRIPADAVFMSLLAVVLAAMSWPLQTLDPGPSLDPSWKVALGMAVTQGLDFGPDVTFSFGPLGFLRGDSTLYAFPWTTRLGFAYTLALQVALCLAILWALRRRFGSLLVAAPLAFVVCTLIFQEPVPVLVFVVGIALVRGELPRRLAPAILLGTGVLIGIQLLGKLNTGMVAAALCAIALLACRERRGAAIGCVGGGLVLALVAGWGLTGQSLAAIPDYVSGSLEVISGYSESMGYEEPIRQWELWAALVLTAIGAAVIVRGDFASPRRMRIGVLAMWLVLAFTAFKSGFVRHDGGHANIFFATMLGGLVVLPLQRLARMTAAFVVLLATTTLLVSMRVPVTDLVEPLGNPSKLARQGRTIADGSRLNARIVAARERLVAGYALDPRIFAALQGHGVHVDPYETNVVWAHRLSWKPVPVFQSYVAYTDGLDERNADAFASPDGPERVLRHNVIAVDNRNPDWESPAAMRSMLCNFRVAAASGQWQVLRRSADRCGPPRRIGDVRARFGEPVVVPPSPGRRSMVYAEIDGAQVHGLERIRTALYRAVARTIAIDGGRMFRLVPGTAADGLIMRVGPAVDFPVPFDLDQATDRFVVTRGAGEQPSGKLRVRFFAVDLR